MYSIFNQNDGLNERLYHSIYIAAQLYYCQQTLNLVVSTSMADGIQVFFEIKISHL